MFRNNKKQIPSYWSRKWEMNRLKRLRESDLTNGIVSTKLIGDYKIECEFINTVKGKVVSPLDEYPPHLFPMVKSFSKEYLEKFPLVRWVDTKGLVFGEGINHPLKECFEDIREGYLDTYEEVLHDEMNKGQFIVRMGLLGRELGLMVKGYEELIKENPSIVDEPLHDFPYTMNWREIILEDDVELTINDLKIIQDKIGHVDMSISFGEVVDDKELLEMENKLEQNPSELYGRHSHELSDEQLKEVGGKQFKNEKEMSDYLKEKGVKPSEVVVMNRPISLQEMKEGRKYHPNTSCPCGSGLKFKRCCLKDENIGVG